MSENHTQKAASGDPVAPRQIPFISSLKQIVRTIRRRQCPRCESDRVCRSHRRFVVERIIGAIVLPYRCELCSLRFFRLRWGMTGR